MPEIPIKEALNKAYIKVRPERAACEEVIRGRDKGEDNKLISLYKLLSPSHLLKLPFANDSNSLNQNFYSELLYIMGLCEDKENGKKVIVRNKNGRRQDGSLIENAIFRLSNYNLTENELFETGLELTIIWIDRILFLKLLESQQLQYRRGSPEYAFLNIGRVKNYSDLQTLFFDVLDKKPEERRENIKKRYGNVPYLNSSLFEMTPVEQSYFSISSLPEAEIEIYSGTVLKNAEGRKRTGPVNTLEYIFEFLDAYDFSSEGSEEIQEENKSLINASVLGLIFEKINGYKDGSYFTPGFITTCICREVIRNVVINRFNEAKNWNAGTIDDIFNKIEDIPEANKIINSITICDPAAGSGHFLVSALNEIIAVKSDLGILADSRGRRLRGYKAEVVNDELMIFDENGDFYAYNYRNEESRRIQETIFQEKRLIIENCLFGVDINPNSVKICRLRLWIELLKNAYYTAESGYTELETFPNIDINIKCGNSLISRFDMDIDLKAELEKNKLSVKEYREAVYNYKNAEAKEEKAKLNRLIAEIKNNFRGGAEKHSRLNQKKYRLHAELAALGQQELFDLTEKERLRKERRIRELSDEITLTDKQIEDIKTNKIYDNAFEWRFEFPEILNNDGDFTGFDAVIGNPPYIFTRGEGFSISEKEYYYSRFRNQNYQLNTFTLFTEFAFELLRCRGSFGYIMPNNWLTIGSSGKFRDFLINNAGNVIIVNNLYKVFYEANVDTSILLFTKTAPTNVTLIESPGPGEYNVVSVLKPDSLLNKKIIQIKKYKGDFDKNIIKKLECNAITLGSIVTVKSGLKAYETGKGNPIQTDEMKNNRIYHSKKKEDKFYRPYLEGKDVKRYKIDWSGLYLKYGDNLAAPRKPELFKGERILVRQIPSRPPYSINAVLTNKNFVNDINSMIITSPVEYSLKYILGIINSHVITYWFDITFDKLQRGIFPQFKVNELAQFPVPKADLSKKRDRNLYDRLISLVDSINDRALSEHEFLRINEQIEKIVFALFNLTEEEIKIIKVSIKEDSGE
jgi:hypothetical protein